MSVVTRLTGVALAGGTLFGIAMASTAPMPVFSSRDAVVRLSLGARPERIESCVAQTNEELERVLPQMRQQVICEGTTARYRMDVRRDGVLLLSRVVRGGGLRNDRQIYVFRELVVPSGPSSIDVRLVRLDTVPAVRERGRDESRERDDERSDRRTEEHIAPDRARREVEERQRRREEAMPPELHLRIDVTLAPREVLLVTYDAEGRQLVAVRDPKRPAAQ